VLAVMLALGQAAAAHADIIATIDAVTVNWTSGQLSAIGHGVADRHAPGPATARAAARERARQDALDQLLRALPRLPWVRPEALATLAERRDWLAARMIVNEAQLAPDGSWRVRLILPIEAVRMAVEGPRRWSGDDAAADDVIIDARRLELSPFGGVTARIDGREVKGPVIWLYSVPHSSSKKSVRLISASKWEAGSLVLDASLAPVADGTRLVIVIGKS
jgi:hypothetical protein